MPRTHQTTVVLVLCGIFLTGCRVAVTPHAIVIEAGDPAFTRIVDGPMVLESNGVTYTQSRAFQDVVTGTVRGLTSK